MKIKKNKTFFFWGVGGRVGGGGGWGGRVGVGGWGGGGSG